jgi:hypothetical protein
MWLAARARQHPATASNAAAAIGATTVEGQCNAAPAVRAAIAGSEPIVSIASSRSA